jgi:tetratricopeptide (TPR) repeat protein
MPRGKKHEVLPHLGAERKLPNSQNGKQITREKAAKLISNQKRQSTPLFFDSNYDEISRNANQTNSQPTENDPTASTGPSATSSGNNVDNNNPYSDLSSYLDSDEEQVDFNDPPLKEDCPICFLPMPVVIISCVSLPPATITSVPIHDFAIANEELAQKAMEQYFVCCGKSICQGCIYSFCQAGNSTKCPFCNSERAGKTDEDRVVEIRKRVEVNDAASISLLAHAYHKGRGGLQQDHAKAIELYAQAADLGHSEAHCQLANIYDEGGNLKKAKFHFEAAAMAGHEAARSNIGSIEFQSGNIERALKHWTIAASAGSFYCMHYLRILFEKGYVNGELIDSTLAAYNNSCSEMRSEARDAYICYSTKKRSVNYRRRKRCHLRLNKLL